MDDINEAIDNELPSLLNPRSREGDGNQGSGSLCASNVYWSLSPLGLAWQLLTVGTTIPGGILYGGTSWMVKPEGLFG